MNRTLFLVSMNQELHLPTNTVAYAGQLEKKLLFNNKYLRQVFQILRRSTTGTRDGLQMASFARTLPYQVT